jgi:hypothetical protein
MCEYPYKKLCLPLGNKYCEEQLLSYQAPTTKAMQTQRHVGSPVSLGSVCNKIGDWGGVVVKALHY